MGNRSDKHGHAKVGAETSTYQTWKHIKARCLNPKNQDYKYYGGRGIKVCERWMDYANFFADMGERPEGLTIEREDNNGNYEPGNCVWDTRRAQVINKRGNFQKGRTGVGGANCPASKLTQQQVDQIKSLRGIKTQREIALLVGTTQPNVCMIQTGQTWE